MDRWEYFQTTAILQLGGTRRRQEQSRDEFDTWLNGLGSQGWEMVGFEVGHLKKAMAFTMVFERRRSPDQ